MVDHRSTKIASRAILEAIEFGQFKAPRICRHMTDPPSRQTVTRILRQLESEGWLERDVDRSSIWRAGPIIQSLNLETSTVRNRGLNKDSLTDGQDETSN